MIWRNLDKRTDRFWKKSRDGPGWQNTSKNWIEKNVKTILGINGGFGMKLTKNNGFWRKKWWIWNVSSTSAKAAYKRKMIWNSSSRRRSDRCTAAGIEKRKEGTREEGKWRERGMLIEKLGIEWTNQGNRNRHGRN